MALLLDVNVLLALAWPEHIHHDAADNWFSANRTRGWATCPPTQLAFLRLSTQPAVVGAAITMADAYEVLAANLAGRDHEFWPTDYPVTDILTEIRERIVGHNQLMDGILLDLAIRKHGCLATFDKRIGSLLPAQSHHLAALEMLPID